MLTANDIYNSPTLSNETWVSINKPKVYQRIKKLTIHISDDKIATINTSLRMDRCVLVY